jgi:tryptophan synthase alpha chain
MHGHGLDTVFLAAPTSTERRIKLVARYSTGFVYLVSRTGVTGERESLADGVSRLIRSVRAATDLPLAVGFGISKPEHVAELGRQVEAVAVGSAIVHLIERSILDNQNNLPLEVQLEAFIRRLKGGFGAHA